MAKPKPRKRADGRYEIRFTKDGTRRSVYGGTKTEVKEKFTRALSEEEVKPKYPECGATLAEFFMEYQDAIKTSMKRYSFDTTRTVARLHLIPELGGLRLARIEREHVQTLYARKLGSGLSPASVRRIHGVLSAALNMAVKWGYLEKNVCADVTPPRVPPPEIRPFTEDEAKRFLQASRGDRYHALYVLGITTGARLGELCGLYWSDLDLERGHMQIQRSLVTGAGGHTFESPKTSNSTRAVTLSMTASNALRAHQERQRRDGIPHQGRELLFTNTSGNPIHRSNLVRRSFKPILKRAGLPDTNFHAATRHTCCCLLLARGVNPKIVSLQLGHSSVAFTLQRYAHYMPGMKGIVGNAMDELLG